MHFSVTESVPHLTWIVFFVGLFSLAVCDPRISGAGLICGNNRPPPNINFIKPFVEEMDDLLHMVASDGWGYHFLNSTSTPVYGLAQCFGDLSRTDCRLCDAAACAALSSCLPATSGRIYLDGCFLRYDNYSFSGETTDASLDTVNCSSAVGIFAGNEAEKSEFERGVGQLFDNLTERAVSEGGFAVQELRGVFGLAQCWKPLSRDGCSECLQKANREVRGCLPNREGRGLNAGCYLRYSTEKFYGHGDENSKGNSRVSTTGTAFAIALPVAAFLMFLLFAAYATYIRLLKWKKERENLGQISNSFNKSGLNFKYETLEKATNFFDASSKIGQGGAGSVFKGTLQDGTTIAVKRLFFNTKQWVEVFFNEVKLISGIQHKNLVKLLGCSIEGPESLLVYEYLPNKSLDHFLFDKNKAQILNWNQRHDVIVGTAEGLAYLHGGSQIRIIHRDIKSSNVLLDENLAPKIADFGLARSLGFDMTHLSTEIAGTLGYMAPEYLVRGQLTEKADVYSFGVLTLEILTGRKNNTFIENMGSLLQTVWMFYKTERLAEAIDPCLKGDFPVKKVSDVFQIGLVCAQASAALRPSMDEVVQMLTIEDYQIPVPKQPPFLNAKMVDPTMATELTYSLASNDFTKIEVSYASTESSSDRTCPDGLLS